MNASYSWLRAFVPTELTPVEMARLFTERCATVDEVVTLRADLEPIVVARVVEAAVHPDSDHLSVTKVDMGTGTLIDVVCGAPNVRAGALYPFAPVGTTMPGGLKIEKRKIRGAVSQGMLCSSKELGLGDDHSGIMELTVDVPVGTPFLRAMPVGDSRIVIDVGPNRPDLLSHVGLARELAAAVGGRFTMPAIPGASTSPLPAPARAGAAGTTAGVSVTLEYPDGAPRYVAAVVRGVKIGPSPAWLAERVVAVGSRSINNVVDATNYVLHELGQPIHAFDLSKLRGNAVIVRRARPNEKLRTLDGTERSIPASVTVIADAEGAQAIAGIMGGADSEITADTTDLFIEVALFDPKTIRASRRSLGMNTDASYRFERGVDPDLPPRALARVLEIILATAGGRVDGTPVDLYPAPKEPRGITLRASRVAQVIGEPIELTKAAELLASVGFDAKPAAHVLPVGVPGWRVDVIEEIDLVEEVARLHGYDRISDELRPFRGGTVPDAPSVIVSRRVRERLVALGLLEARPLPFVAGADDSHVRVANPISESEAHLRRGVLETLARRAEFNLAQMQRTIRLFEIGAVFEPVMSAMPVEELRVAALVLGDRHPPHFTDPRPPAFDAWDIKFLAEETARAAFPGETVTLDPGQDDLLWKIWVGNLERGSVRRVALDAPVWAAAAFGFELTLERVDSGNVAPPGASAYSLDAADRSSKAPSPYRPIPSTPAVEVDLALLVPDSVPASEVERVLIRTGGDLLERIALFDEFRGGDVPAGQRSLAWRLTFRHADRTLGTKEVDGRRQKILKVLEAELGIRQRTS